MLGIYAAAAYALTQAIYPVVRYAQNWIDKLNSDLNTQNSQGQDTSSDAADTNTNTQAPAEAQF